VLSRCLQFNLKRLSMPLIRARLKHILDAEGIAFEAPALQLLAQAADGSLRDALSLLDQLLAFGNGAAREAEARAMLGTVAVDHVAQIARLLAAADPAALLAGLQSLEELSPDFGGLLDQLAALLERVALQQLLPDYAGDELFEPELVRELATRLGAEDVQLYYQTAILGRRDLALAPDPRTGFRMTLIRMLAFRPDTAGQPNAVRSAAPGAAVASAGTSHAAPVRSATQELKAAAAVGLPDWAALLAALELDGPTRMLAQNCVLLSRAPGLLQLQLDPRQQGARTRSREEKLAQALSRHLGETLRLEIEVGASVAETPAQAGERQSQEALAAARAQLLAEPTVQALQERFAATINPDSVRLRGPG